jgi:hypothetical protein
MSSSLDKCELHALCESCFAIFGNAKEIREPYGMVVPSYFGTHRLHESVEKLEESINRRCHFCTMAGKALFSPHSRHHVPEKEWLPENREKEKRDREARRGAMRGPVWIKIYRDEKRLMLDITCGIRGRSVSHVEDKDRWYWPEYDGFGTGQDWRSLYFCPNWGVFGNTVQRWVWKKSVGHDAHSYMKLVRQDCIYE